MCAAHPSAHRPANTKSTVTAGAPAAARVFQYHVSAAAAASVASRSLALLHVVRASPNKRGATLSDVSAGRLLPNARQAVLKQDDSAHHAPRQLEQDNGQRDDDGRGAHHPGARGR